MSPSGPAEITRLLQDLAAGAPAAAEALYPLVYNELRALAGSYFRSQRADHTLQPTALVNEAYLRMAEHGSELGNREHFFALSARVMRQVLVDHARSKQAEKRGGERKRVLIDDAASPLPDPAIDVIALDDALKKLAVLRERTARLVELRYFAGLSIEEAANLLGVARVTATEDWRFARAWLIRELRGTDAS